MTAHHRRQSEPGSQSAEAYAHLREKIITLELPPASPLNEAALRNKLGFGRTPLREAIQRPRR